MQRLFVAVPLQSAQAVEINLAVRAGTFYDDGQCVAHLGKIEENPKNFYKRPYKASVDFLAVLREYKGNHHASEANSSTSPAR